MSERTPKYPIGSMVMHRASGERAIITQVETYCEDPDDWSYYLEHGIDRWAKCYGCVLDQRFVPVDENGYRVFTFSRSSAAPSPASPESATPLEAAPPQPE